MARKKFGKFEKADTHVIWALYLAAITTVAVTPNINFDPINVIKLVLVTASGFLFLPSYIKSARNFGDEIRKPIFFLTTAGLISLIIFGFINNENWGTTIYGGYGRNTGLVYFLASILLIFGIARVPYLLLFFAPRILLGTWLIVFFYGALQLFELDPVNWNNQYNPVISTLGNPNFSSAFLGMSGILWLILVLDRSFSLKLRLVGAFFICSNIYLILKTESIQGMIIFSIGIVLTLSFYFSVEIFRSFRMFVLSISALILVGSFLFIGLLGNGPLGSILQRRTLMIRIDYWRTSIEILQDFPLGIGFDQLGNYFHSYRDQQTIQSIGPNVFTNSAHNVFLDLALNSGIVTALIFFAIKVYVFGRFVRYIYKCFPEVSTSKFVIFAAWIAYEFQALISVNQIGIGIWGSILTGIVLASTFHDEEKTATRSFSQSNDFQNIWAFIASFISVCLIFPALSADAKFRSSLEDGEMSKILASIQAFPISDERYRFTIVLLDQQGFTKEAANLAAESISKFPDNYQLWKLQLSLRGVDEEQKNIARQRMEILDPLVFKKP